MAYDLTTNVFRTGTVNDMVTKTCGIRFTPHYDEEKLEWLENLILNNFEEGDGKYFLKYFASMLEASNDDETFHFLVELKYERDFN